MSPAVTYRHLVFPPISLICITTCPCRLQFLSSDAALTKSACCRRDGKIQKTVKMGFGKSGGPSGKSDFWQRHCVSCGLAKTEPFRAPGFPLGWGRARQHSSLSGSPGFCPPQLVLSLMWLKDQGNWARPGGRRKLACLTELQGYCGWKRVGRSICSDKPSFWNPFS